MSKTPPWADYFTMDNLPNEDLKIVATFIGLEPTVTLICELSGSTISIPKQATLPARKAYIKKQMDGCGRPFPFCDAIYERPAL